MCIISILWEYSRFRLRSENTPEGYLIITIKYHRRHPPLTPFWVISRSFLGQAPLGQMDLQLRPAFFLPESCSPALYEIHLQIRPKK